MAEGWEASGEVVTGKNPSGEEQTIAVDADGYIQVTVGA